MPKKILVIQTAFTGDVILATSLLESIHHSTPDAEIDVLVRAGNENLLDKHPFVHRVLVWNKKADKWKNLFSVLITIRKSKYDTVINLQRFASTGLLTALSGAKQCIGFDKNPLSVFFDKRVKHVIGDGRHEIDRNYDLIRSSAETRPMPPKLYPDTTDLSTIKDLSGGSYVCIAPGSVWFTKKWPEIRWIELIRLHLKKYPDDKIYLLGAPSENEICQRIVTAVNAEQVLSLSGKLTLLQSAALMKNATMNYVNDSAPLHLASAMNAPVTAIFCSTLPEFGFGPLSTNSRVIQVNEKLTCRPCGLHGLRACPEKHFNCAMKIPATQAIA